MGTSILQKRRARNHRFGTPYAIKKDALGIIIFVNPVFMTIFSVLILKHSIGLHRLGAIIIGLLGTLFIIKPSFNNFNWYMLLPLITAISYALGMTLSKMTSDKDSSFQQSFHIYLGGFIFGTLISIAISKNLD